jgi:uncharacterized protein (DUF2147 family)
MYLHRTQFVGVWLLGVVSILTLSTQTAFAEDTGIFGYWKFVDEDVGKTQSVIRLWEDKGKLLGKIVKVFFKRGGGKRQETCSDCPGATRDKPIDGMIFMWNFVRAEASANKWIEGKILNPEDGKTYNCELELSKDGKTLAMYGYIRILVKIGGTTTWQRPTLEEIQAANAVRPAH